MLHNVPSPDRVIAEMLRVARVAVFMSDSNDYGIGSPPKRLMKYALGRRVQISISGTRTRLAALDLSGLFARLAAPYWP